MNSSLSFHTVEVTSQMVGAPQAQTARDGWHSWQSWCVWALELDRDGRALNR